MKLGNVLRSSLGVALTLAACSGATEEDSASRDAGTAGTGSYGGGECAGYPGDCFYSCGPLKQQICVSGQWVCSQGGPCSDASGECIGTPSKDCYTPECGLYGPSCVGGEWQCVSKTDCDAGVAPECEGLDESTCAVWQEQNKCSAYYGINPAVWETMFMGCGAFCIGRPSTNGCALSPTGGACWGVSSTCVLPGWTLSDCAEAGAACTGLSSPSSSGYDKKGEAPDEEPQNPSHFLF